jgi:hypothetical protein
VELGLAGASFFFDKERVWENNQPRSPMEERCMLDIHRERKFIQAQKEEMQQWVQQLRENDPGFVSGFYTRGFLPRKCVDEQSR